LRTLDQYLEQHHPDLHSYVHKRYLLHVQSGKRAIQSATIIADLEAPDEAPAGLATPKRRTAPVPRTPDSLPTPAGDLTEEQARLYKVLPGLIEDAEARLAAIVLKFVTSPAGRDELKAAHPGRGTAMLQALELRGTPDASTFDGHQLRQLRLQQLHQFVAAGISTPSYTTWANYDRTIRMYAEAAGGISDADHHGYLFSAVARFPEKLRDRLRQTTTLHGLDPSAFYSAVSE
jgi:hypothetical protein